MKKFFYDWKLWKHLIISLSMCLLIRIIFIRFNQYIESSSIGIVGGADGPTAVFISGNIYTTVVINVCTAIVFLIVLALYVPTKSLFKKLLH